MIPEEFKRTIDFILQTQAKSEAKMDRMHDEFQQEHRRLQGRIDGLLSACKDLVQVSRHLLEVTQAHTRRLDRPETSES